MRPDCSPVSRGTRTLLSNCWRRNARARHVRHPSRLRALPCSQSAKRVSHQERDERHVRLVLPTLLQRIREGALPQQRCRISEAQQGSRAHRPPTQSTVVADYLSTHPCVDCGEADPVVLEFGHRDRNEKRADVGRLIHTSTVNVVRAEIEKCDVRCGNCHRVRTARQLGWYRLGEADLAYFV